jgi:NADH-quinone oxidoreductase subunit M
VLARLALGQSALVVASLAAGEAAGRRGGLLLAAVLALAGTGLALAVQALEARRGALDLRRLGGGYAELPGLAAATLLLALAGAGLPGTLGYLAEDLALHALLAHHPLAAAAFVAATALTGAAALRLVLRLYGGPGAAPRGADLRGGERAALWALVLALVAGAWLPGLLG